VGSDPVPPPCSQSTFEDTLFSQTLPGSHRNDPSPCAGEKDLFYPDHNLHIYTTKREDPADMYPGTGEPQKNSVIPGSVIHLLWGMVLLTILFCALIVFIPLEIYRFYGNFFNVGVALFCMISCLYAYRAWSERIIIVLAAFAFGEYALSNTFWYLYSIPFGRQNVFFTVSELGFIGFMLFFIVAFRIEFPQKPRPVSSRIAMGSLFLFIALLALMISGVTLNMALFLFHLLIVALLMDGALDHGVDQYPLLWPGICLWSSASILYGLRDTVVITNAERYGAISFTPNHLTPYGLLSIVGPLIILSFLLIQLGIFRYINSQKK
jgi:hypothetical protein